MEAFPSPLGLFLESNQVITSEVSPRYSARIETLFSCQVAQGKRVVPEVSAVVHDTRPYVVGGESRTHKD